MLESVFKRRNGEGRGTDVRESSIPHRQQEEQHADAAAPRRQKKPLRLAALTAAATAVLGGGRGGNADSDNNDDEESPYDGVDAAEAADASKGAIAFSVAMQSLAAAYIFAVVAATTIDGRRRDTYDASMYRSTAVASAFGGDATAAPSLSLSDEGRLAVVLSSLAARGETFSDSPLLHAMASFTVRTLSLLSSSFSSSSSLSSPPFASTNTPSSLLHRIVTVYLPHSVVGWIAAAVLFAVLWNTIHYYVWGSSPGFAGRGWGEVDAKQHSEAVAANSCGRSSASAPPASLSMPAKEESMGSVVREEGLVVDGARNSREEAPTPRLRSSPPHSLPLRRCGKCRLSQPLRSKHCNKCGRCVLKYDHHCFWLGTCVGERNHFRFVVLLAIGTVYLFLGAGLFFGPLSGWRDATAPPAAAPLGGWGGGRGGMGRAKIVEKESGNSADGSSTAATTVQWTLPRFCAEAEAELRRPSSSTSPSSSPSQSSPQLLKSAHEHLCSLEWLHNRPLLFNVFANALPLLIGAIAAALGLFCFILLAAHTALVATNQTTWEASSAERISYMRKGKSGDDHDQSGFNRRTLLFLSEPFSAIEALMRPPFFSFPFSSNEKAASQSSTRAKARSLAGADDGVAAVEMEPLQREPRGDEGEGANRESVMVVNNAGRGSTSFDRDASAESGGDVAVTDDSCRFDRFGRPALWVVGLIHNVAVCAFAAAAPRRANSDDLWAYVRREAPQPVTAAADGSTAVAFGAVAVGVHVRSGDGDDSDGDGECGDGLKKRIGGGDWLANAFLRLFVGVDARRWGHGRCDAGNVAVIGVAGGSFRRSWRALGVRGVAIALAYSLAVGLPDALLTAVAFMTSACARVSFDAFAALSGLCCGSNSRPASSSSSSSSCLRFLRAFGMAFVPLCLAYRWRPRRRAESPFVVLVSLAYQSCGCPKCGAGLGGARADGNGGSIAALLPWRLLDRGEGSASPQLIQWLLPPTCEQ